MIEINPEITNNLFERIHKCDFPIYLFSQETDYVNIRPDGFIRIPRHYRDALGSPAVFECFFLDGGLVFTPLLDETEELLFSDKYKSYSKTNMESIHMDIAELHYQASRCCEFNLKKSDSFAKKSYWSNYKQKPFLSYLEECAVNIDTHCDLIVPNAYLLSLGFTDTAIAILLSDAFVLVPIKYNPETQLPDEEQFTGIGNARFTNNILLTTQTVREISMKTPVNASSQEKYSSIEMICSDILDKKFTPKDETIEEEPFMKYVSEMRFRKLDMLL